MTRTPRTEDVVMQDQGAQQEGPTPEQLAQQANEAQAALQAVHDAQAAQQAAHEAQAANENRASMEAQVQAQLQTRLNAQMQAQLQAHQQQQAQLQAQLHAQQQAQLQAQQQQLPILHNGGPSNVNAVTHHVTTPPTTAPLPRTPSPLPHDVTNLAAQMATMNVLPQQQSPLPLPLPPPPTVGNVIQMSPDALAAMIATALAQAQGQRNDSNHSNTAGKHISKPEFLTLDFINDKGGPTMADRKDIFMMNFHNWAEDDQAAAQLLGRYSSILPQRPSPERVLEEVSLSPGTRHMSWEEFSALLDSLVTGTSATGFDAAHSVFDYSLAVAASANGEYKQLPQVIAELEQSMDQSPLFEDDRHKCFILYKAFPSPLKPLIRYDTTSGTSEEWNDYDRMKNHVMTLAGVFMDHVKATYATPPAKRRPDHTYLSAVVTEPEKKGRADAEEEEDPDDPTMQKDQTFRNGFNPLEAVPPSERRYTFQQGDTYWIRNLDHTRFKQLSAAKKCLLCQKPNHMLSQCRDHKKMFDKGSFFYYPRKLKGK